MNKLIKFSRAILAIAMMLLTWLPTLAHDFEVDGICYNYIDKTARTVEVTEKWDYSKGSNEYIGNITIPKSIIYKGTSYYITRVGNTAFKNCANLTSVTIPNSVTMIGIMAFCNCTSLTSISIGNSVTEIGSYAFEGCSSLTSITIPNSIISIDSGAFSNCTGLTEVNISNLLAWCNINFNGYYSNPLYYAKKFNLNGTVINDLVIPNNITIIKKYAFNGYSGLTSVTMGNSVTSIDDYAFKNCTSLTSVAIGNSVTSIGKDAFYNCVKLTSINIPNSVTVIDSNAFLGCEDLSKVNISDLSAWCNINFNGYYSNPLYYAKTLNLNWIEINDLVIPNNVTEIKQYVFFNCDCLTSVTIPNSITKIDDQAFYHCGDIETIVSLNPAPPICSSNNSFYSRHYTSATLYIPKDSYAKYFADELWGQFNNIKKIETLVTSITLNNTTSTINSGSHYALNANISPSNATFPNLTWESDNSAVATVDQNGRVTGISAGTATITVRANDGSNVTATCKVAVNSATPTITLSQTEATLPVNEIMTLSYSITNSAAKTATWSTSDANVAYVKTNSDGSATIVGMADGIATITATTIDNGKEYSASCVVTVGVGGVEGIEVDNNAVEVARYDIYGRLLNEPTKGINIVKYSDGSTRKECVK